MLFRCFMYIWRCRETRWTGWSLQDPEVFYLKYWIWTASRTEWILKFISLDGMIEYSSLTLRKCLVAKKRDESVSCAFAHCSANGVRASKQSWQTSELILINPSQGICFIFFSFPLCTVQCHQQKKYTLRAWHFSAFYFRIELQKVPIMYCPSPSLSMQYFQNRSLFLFTIHFNSNT